MKFPRFIYGLALLVAATGTAAELQSEASRDQPVPLNSNGHLVGD